MLFLSTGDNSTPFDEKTARPMSTTVLLPRRSPRSSAVRCPPKFRQQQRPARKNSPHSCEGRWQLRYSRWQPVSAAGAQGQTRDLCDGRPQPLPDLRRSENSFLYWGEVGPDSNVDSFETRGPGAMMKSTRPANRVILVGPLFVGDNYPYHHYDYGTGQTGLCLRSTAPGE